MNKLLHILHLEDDPDYADLVKEMLEGEGFAVEMARVDNYGDFVATLDKNRFDVILGDYSLPACNGLQALEAARRKCPDTPFLLISGVIGETAAVESLKSGAADYVLKQWPERLVPAVRRAVHEAEEHLERKQAEARLRLQSAALESTANAILITDRAGKVLWINPAFTRLTGYASHEILGQNPRLLKSGRHNKAFYQNLWETILAGRVWHAEMINRHKDASLYAEENTITPVLDQRGEITYFIAVKQDVTERKELESQLRQAQKMEALGQLAGGVAHDFNNLLTVIRGNTELVLLDAGQFSNQARECLQQVVAASERAANLTRQLLTFGSKRVMRPQALDLNEVVRNLTKMLTRIIGENIQMQCAYDTGLPCVQADVGMIEQVLVNLVVNARDAMPRGGQLFIATEKISIEKTQVRVHPEARGGDFVCLNVRDTGTGIRPEHLPRIFEPFFSTKEPGKGSGLGLATVHGIVRQHQGWVQVSTQIGTGTTLRVFLPVIPAPRTGIAHPEAEPSLRGGTEGILLVEDDLAVRLTTHRVLEAFGYHVWEAATGREALGLWSNHAKEIALLLTDMVLPDAINGRELAKQLRAQRSDLKAVFISGYGPEVAFTDKDLLQQNQPYVLQKPCSSQVLLHTLRQCLDDKQPAECGLPNGGARGVSGEYPADGPPLQRAAP
jgi:two-component system, cell cycle sensor histidine kinase and response regulator CckA